MQFTTHVISRHSTVNSPIAEISNNSISGHGIFVDRGKILFLIHSVVLSSRNDLMLWCLSIEMYKCDRNRKKSVFSRFYCTRSTVL